MLLQNRHPLHEDLAVSSDLVLMGQRLLQGDHLSSVRHCVRLHVVGSSSSDVFLPAGLWILSLLTLGGSFVFNSIGRDFECQEILWAFERIEEASHGHIETEEEVSNVAADFNVIEVESERKDLEERDQQIVDFLVVELAGLEEVLLAQVGECLDDLVRLVFVSLKPEQEFDQEQAVVEAHLGVVGSIEAVDDVELLSFAELHPLIKQE